MRQINIVEKYITLSGDGYKSLWPKTIYLTMNSFSFQLLKSYLSFITYDEKENPKLSIVIEILRSETNII